MERQIPHILDVFTSSPGARRRMRANLVSTDKEEFQKNPGSDSAVSVGSSDDESDEQKHISKYFDYLNEDDFTGSSQRKKKKKSSTPGKENSNKDPKAAEEKKDCVQEKNEKNKTSNDKKDKSNRKGEHEKDIRHIERHLSMKKTIRKKMMRDLQQAFVEDPKDLQQDPKSLADDKKNNIDINNLTFSKNRISKSEHNFLDMLKEDQGKERKGLRALIDFRKDKSSASSATNQSGAEEKSKSNDSKTEAKHPDEKSLKTSNNTKFTESKSHQTKSYDSKFSDDDSGHDSPTRDIREPLSRRCKSRDDLEAAAGVQDGDCGIQDGPDCKNDGAISKKPSFWKRFTGKSKTKR
ncbi:hypothetical protein FHG87_009665 [Trinorchestia longiramus]|nr:hypothetical protein FHG87_009665 [Trinorchestia longiramus]